ncbi:uncharacterized protein LOC122375265 isoform X1 [Amphibalanus amphitrite]|uniref:uncharacterized protein LOC122375265 isoform X1 n=1 Tax=Amphibalanus amphitrite TaxID=1232801 RepID=UPI001C90C322|nr:uncharacterized protein LOC122375265 isoform X1 [Amphibalanus amphitrite]
MGRTSRSGRSAGAVPGPAADRTAHTNASAGSHSGVPGQPDGGLPRSDGLRHLDGLAEQLVVAGLAPATRRLYDAGARRYRRFCRTYRLVAAPADEQTVLRFIAHLVRRGLTAARISTVLAGVRHWHVRRGAPWIGRTDKVRLALRGAAKIPHAPRAPRVAATPSHLRRLHSELGRAQMHPVDRAAAWAAVLLGFFGALRGSEYLSPTAHTYDPRRTCQWRHLTLKRGSLRLTIPASKTDQVYQGSVVSLPALDGPVCPVTALRQYRRLRPDRHPDRPLFERADGRHCTAGWLNGVLRDAGLTRDGRLTTHSLRIGFATAAAAAGVSESVIRVSGRWRGSSYLRYVRGPRLAVWQACQAIV